MIDLSGKIKMRQLSDMLRIPWIDVDVALAMVHPLQITNTRWYDKREACAALETYYTAKAELNREKYRQTGTETYRRRERTCAERLARIREYLAGLEAT